MSEANGLSKKDKKKLRQKAAKQHKQELRFVIDERKRESDAEREAQPAKRRRTDDDEPDIVVEYVFRPPKEFENVLDAAAPDSPGDAEAAGDADGEWGLGEGLGSAARGAATGGDGGMAEVFANYFAALMPEKESGEGEEGGEDAGGRGGAGAGASIAGSDAEEDEDAPPKPSDGLSKKRRRELSRLKVSDLKQRSARPDTVELWDVTAPDPLTLVHLKAYRNTVPVPRHWSQKRAYLQGKRGLEKPPFKLPDYIEATGIGELREAYHDKEDAKKGKQKGRERVRPKMNRLDINYEVLRDAFFRHQTKPRMSGWGELYYEGKEFDVPPQSFRPGELSEALRAALEMGGTAPPPWLINMQRYGPPPSYPSLPIPGLSAPLPPGARYGFGPGEWGKPPVDERGRPIYGDVFGTQGGGVDGEKEAAAWERGVDKTKLWGPLEEAEEEEEVEEEEEEEEEEVEETPEGARSSLPSGTASQLPVGLATPDALNLRKEGTATETPLPQPEKKLYTVLEQKQVGVGAASLMGSDHVYVIPGGAAGAARPAAAAASAVAAAAAAAGDVQVSFTPEELEGLDDKAIRELYERRVEEERSRRAREDFSDLVAEKARAQLKKLERDKAKKSEAGKDKFKF